jgi:hypothetical protein
MESPQELPYTLKAKLSRPAPVAVPSSPVASTWLPDTAATGRQPRRWQPSWVSRGTRCHCSKATSAKPEDCERVLAEVLAKYDHLDNIRSIIGETGSIGQANYATSKSVLFDLTKSLSPGNSSQDPS